MKRRIAALELAALVGQEIGVSGWFPVDQPRIARLTGDEQWIHVDVGRAARETGGTIAHGLLTLSLMPAMTADIWEPADAASTLNYGFDRIRFTAPVQAGGRVRLRETLLRVEPRPGGALVTRHCLGEAQGGARPVLVADWLVLLRFG